jgi:hypothetical protein
MKKIITSIIIFTMLILLSACSSTVAQVIEEYKEPFAQKREQLVTIAESLPPVGSIVENSYCENLNPALILKDDSSGKELTSAILMYDQVLNPDLDRSSLSRWFNVGMNGLFINALSWTGPENPMSKSVMQEYDNGFTNRLETALATPYLVINRVADYSPAILVNENSFIPGRVIIESFVTSMENNTILCSYRVDVTLSEETVYYRKVGDELAQIFAPGDALQRALEKETCLAIQETLTEITGGSVTYNESSLP